MANEVFMNIPEVETLSAQFKSYSEILKVCARMLEAASNTLKFTAWMSLGAGAAAAAFIDRIKPNFDRAAEKMEELSEDLLSAIRMYRDGDTDGSRRFC